MTPHQYREALAALGETQAGAARHFGVNEKTSRDWADPRMKGPPEPVARILRFLLANQFTLDEFAQDAEWQANNPVEALDRRAS